MAADRINIITPIIAPALMLLSAAACATDAVHSVHLGVDLMTLVREIDDSPISLHQTLISNFGSQIESPDATIELGPLLSKDGFRLSNISIRRGLPHYSGSSSVVMSLDPTPCYSTSQVRRDFSIADTGTVQQVKHGPSGALESTKFIDWMASKTPHGEIKFFHDRSECVATIQINRRAPAKHSRNRPPES
ncbi:hypothetical protein MNO14_08580 [Luteimonas sp. S4-F44]|uniref:hypothetical protein n=1 Tax=Luteimonas sp. S4-F44 TaxID=2925842 RepID=UPI001F52C7A4|nr:hypothetical protein [Luteimonas sp. S4-F44]UNK41048.1 hypothetical protein MNO14_08580 [Luteimonas sp. S4-F44]